MNANKKMVQLNDDNSTIGNVINLIHESVGSLYTKDDVLKLIGTIEFMQEPQKECLIEIKEEVTFILNKFSTLFSEAEKNIIEVLEDTRNFELEDYTLSIDYNNQVIVDASEINFKGETDITEEVSHLEHEITSTLQEFIKAIDANTIIRNTECQK